MKKRFGPTLRLAKVVAATAVSKLRPKTYPPRKEIPGRKNKRSALNWNVFLAEMWKEASGRKISSEHFLTTESFVRYITYIDDLIDVPKRPPIRKNFSFYKKDQIARLLISDFVQRVIESKRLGKITKEQQNEIFKVAGNYRRQSIRSLNLFEETKKPTFDDIKTLKEKTTGGMGAVVSDILSIAQNAPAPLRKSLRKAFSNSFMASQVADDIADIRQDLKNNVPNLAIQLLIQNQTEWERLKEVNFDSSSFRKKAPVTYQKLLRVANGYIEQIPVDSSRMGVLKTVSRFFYRFTSFTQR